jgi:hypothetical protein
LLVLLLLLLLLLLPMLLLLSQHPGTPSLLRRMYTSAGNLAWLYQLPSGCCCCYCSSCCCMHQECRLLHNKHTACHTSAGDLAWL